MGKFKLYIFVILSMALFAMPPEFAEADWERPNPPPQNNDLNSVRAEGGRQDTDADSVCRVCGAEIAPDIKANNQSDFINITPADKLLLTIGLSDGDFRGGNADWWLLANTPFGWYHYQAEDGAWAFGAEYGHQGPLFDFVGFNVLDAPLPAGVYTIYFGVDTVMDGSLDLDQAHYDTVKVHITEQQNPDMITNRLGMAFVHIEPGEFMMGSPWYKPCRSDNERRHEVILEQGYYMQTTEVTQAQWQAVMGNNPSYFDDCGRRCPVETVSWFDAQDFIDVLNDMGEGTYRLPTEAEWEYACRAGSTTAFANGKITGTSCNIDPNLDAMGWYYGNSNNKTHPVGQKQANAWDLYDMHGNVWEWCQDWFADYPTYSLRNPKGPSYGTYRVLRGGSWNQNARFCRSACRFSLHPSYENIYTGFRLVLTPAH